MSSRRPLKSDPRTLAREIPGLLEGLFPHLVPGVVGHLNRQSSQSPDCTPVTLEEVQESELARAMLFELAVAAAEQLLGGVAVPDWETALRVAVARQKRHFDARLPKSLAEVDKKLALRVASNLVVMLEEARATLPSESIKLSPTIPGFRWIVSGLGDFAVGQRLIEVKCTGRGFSSADYRQVLIYWLLSYASAVERGRQEWLEISLMNPRHGSVLTLMFDDLVSLLGGGRSKVELLEVFSTIVDERAGRMGKRQ